MPSVPFFLVTGFLGSGKTTLLKRILAAHAGSKRLAVIQNEFADAGVYAAELRALGQPFEIVEIDCGSVFCVCLLGDFVAALEALLDRGGFDGVVLEATGLADPVAIGQVLQAPRLRGRLSLAHAWCVVDASSFLKLETAVVRMAHHVRVADTVILNKIDKDLSEEGALRRRILEINPFAVVRTASFCDVPVESMFQRAAAPVAVRRADGVSGGESGGRPPVGSAVIRTGRRISRGALDRFLSGIVPSVWRVKGTVALEGGGGRCRSSRVLGTCACRRRPGARGPRSW
jgi:G3E family GTPase